MLPNKYLLIFFAIAHFSVNCAPKRSFDELPIVKTKSGDIIGSIATTLLDQRKFFSFQGIPYAKPPIGPLRFRVSTLVYLINDFLLKSLVTFQCIISGYV